MAYYYYYCIVVVILIFTGNGEPRIRSHYRGHKMALWLNLIPQLHQSGGADVSMLHHNFREERPEYYEGSFDFHIFLQHCNSNGIGTLFAAFNQPLRRIIVRFLCSNNSNICSSALLLL